MPIETMQDLSFPDQVAYFVNVVKFNAINQNSIVFQEFDCHLSCCEADVRLKTGKVREHSAWEFIA